MGTSATKKMLARLLADHPEKNRPPISGQVVQKVRREQPE
jgi:hypothetical protein